MSNLSQLLDRKVKIYINATGAGAGLQKRLWDIAGCSSFFVGAQFPYGTEKTVEIIGYEPKSFCSKETALELAMAAYKEAYDPIDGSSDVVGIGLTASVSSLHPHKGDHRVFVAAVSNTKCIVKSIIIQKGDASYRAADGEIADELGELALLEVLGISSVPSELFAGNVLKYETEEFSDQYLIDLIMNRPYLKADGTRGLWIQPMMKVHHYNGNKLITSDTPSCNVIYAPGTYNPFHYGHEQAAEAAKNSRINDKSSDVTLIYTACINPIHKPITRAADLLQKISQMKGRNFLLTKDDGLFLDKARANPNAGFVLGADALLTMLNPKWYKDPGDVEKMLEELNNLNVKFYIVGRLVNGVFLTLKDIQQQHPNIINYCFLFCSVPGRWDVSSTELRKFQT